VARRVFHAGPLNSFPSILAMMYRNFGRSLGAVYRCRLSICGNVRVLVVMTFVLSANLSLGSASDRPSFELTDVIRPVLNCGICKSVSVLCTWDME